VVALSSRLPARDRRDAIAGIGTLIVGLFAILAAELLGPLAGPPLYDGVIPIEAYRWLSPPPGEHGGAKGITQVLPVSGASSPLITLATTELTPQAQLFAQPGALSMPAGTNSLSVSITPVPPTAQPTAGHIAGNVYRITITTQAGVRVTAPPSAEVTVVLRAPDVTATQGTVALLSKGVWQPLKTDAAGLGASFVTVVTSFGDFALLEPGPGPSGLGPSGLVSSPAVSESAGGATTAAGSSDAAVAPRAEPGIPIVTIVAGIATVLVLGALVALAVLPRRPRRGEWTERRDRGPR
jgi:hypothetical protein